MRDFLLYSENEKKIYPTLELMMKKILLLFLLPAVLLSGCLSSFINSPTYSVVKLKNNDGETYNLMCDKQHFLTLVDEKGTLNFRPHPGVDPNGWGSSWYIQPFLPGATLSHTIIESIKATGNGISVLASGKVSQGKDSTFGDWNISIKFEFNQADKEITGSGKYSIQLADNLSKSTGNLNIYKIASNYLVDVPLFTGKIGDTGDMTEAIVEGGNFKFNWDPKSQPNYFDTQQPSSKLLINVTGAYNNVNTAAQGFSAIAPAYKPSLEVYLISTDPEVNIIFGGIFNLEQKEIFYFDNVGITPVISSSSPITKFDFDVEFKSKALPEDGS